MVLIACSKKIVLGIISLEYTYRKVFLLAFWDHAKKCVDY